MKIQSTRTCLIAVSIMAAAIALPKISPVVGAFVPAWVLSATVVRLAIIAGAGGVIWALSVGRDIARSAHHYRLVFEQNPHAMWVYNPDRLTFLAVNQAAADQYGYSPGGLSASAILHIRPERNPPPSTRSARDTALSRGTWHDRTNDGRTLKVEVTTTPVSWGGRSACLVLVDDTRERKHLEAQLRQAQKMEAIGQLAGGVAHDFNNVLTAILGYSALLAEQIGPDKPMGRDLREITVAAQRAAALTRQLLAFSRKQVLAVVALDLNQIVRSVEAMLSRLLGEQIAIRTALAGDLYPVLADATQLEQVLMNLSVNARDAMPQGGVLTIETRNAELDEGYASAHAGAKPGSYAMLSVSDTGVGMTRELQARIFEPFFTTKERERGTGLGLAAVYGIVKQLGGYVWVDSEPGRGTTFAIYLARTDREPEAPPARAAAVVSPVGTETILLVEDESSVRLFTKNALQRYGYHVVEAESAEAALTLLEGSDASVHLLLTDIVLPRMDGRELAARVKRDRPYAQVLYMSGYADRVGSDPGFLEPGDQLLEKPFTAHALLTKTRQLLDGVIV